MGKKLVGIDNLEAAICQGKIYVDGTIILTPGAKDELTRRGIPIVYGPKPEAVECGSAPAAEASAPALENLLLVVAGILKNQCGVNDPEQLRALSCQVVKTIKENI